MQDHLPNYSSIAKRLPGWIKRKSVIDSLKFSETLLCITMIRNYSTRTEFIIQLENIFIGYFIYSLI